MISELVDIAQNFKKQQELEEIIISEGIKQVLSFFFDKGKEKLSNTDLSISYDEDSLLKSLTYHIVSIKNWAKEVSFNDSKEAKYTKDIYVELDIFLYPQRIRVSDDEEIMTIPLKKILSHTHKHIALLGQVGAGKTTSMKTLCNSVFYDESFHKDDFKLPVLIRFRDFNSIKREKDNVSLIFQKLRDIFCVQIDLKNAGEEDHDYVENVRNRFVIDILNTIPILLILDGFDELSYKKDREIILREIDVLAQSVEMSRMIITSRPSDFNYSFENISKFDIAPLSEHQIVEFSEKWLKNDSLSEEFMNQIQKSPFYDTSIKPLNLAHLCAIYERIGRIPDKPKTVYRKLINLLLEEWDEQRRIHRKSKYANFETDRKVEFLSALSFKLTANSVSQVFSKGELKKYYLELYEDFDLERVEMNDVVSEVESHTGLIIQSGYDRYEFAHKSLQEFLSAEYIVKLPSIPTSNRVLSRLPNELAIAVAISSNPSEYFYSLVAIMTSSKLFHKIPIGAFISRLLLEKPDFKQSDKLGTAFITLYSGYLEGGTKDKNRGQLKLFILDDLITEFEELIKLILKRTAFTGILEKYNFASKIDDADTDGIAVYHLDDEAKREGIDAENVYFNTRVIYPKKLYIRSSFFDKYGINT